MIELELLKNDGLQLKYIPSGCITVEMCEVAIKQNAHAIEFIPDRFKLDVSVKCLEHIKSFVDNHTSAEFVIKDAIDKQLPGFCNGWISSIKLNELFIKHCIDVPVNQRRSLLALLGYKWHPYLNQGRVNNEIIQEGGKPRLFIEDCHLHSIIDKQSKIVEKYCDAQGYVDELTSKFVSTVKDAIDEQLPGFRNGWISSIKLNELIDIPVSKRGKLLALVGYEKHPSLRDRLNSKIDEEGGKPILFTTRNNPDNAVFKNSTIANLYRKSQGYQPSNSRNANDLTSADVRSKVVAIAANLINQNLPITFKAVSQKAKVSMQFMKDEFIDVDELISDARMKLS